MNSKLTAEGIMGAVMRMGAELSGGELPISVFPHKIQFIITELNAGIECLNGMNISTHNSI